jgi:hypothetical protein
MGDEGKELFQVQGSKFKVETPNNPDFELGTLNKALVTL